LIKVGIVCGGPSSEHEISCISASGVLASIDRSKYQPVLVGITRSGKWVLPGENYPLKIEAGKLPEISEDFPATNINDLDVDLLFPVLHGSYGEDGGFQAECEAAGINYVGSGVSASQNGMDKALTKPIFTKAGLQVAKDVVIQNSDWESQIDAKIDECQELGFPLFVKPAKSGSSRGTSKAKNLSELKSAIDFAFEYDDKVLVEQAIAGREIECAVLQVAGDTKASPLGEIKILGNHEFYDFEAKYLDGSTKLIIPAEISESDTKKIQSAAITAFQALGCAGLARVDFFYCEGNLVINEINTMPGFTATSMFPRMWQAGGIAYQDLISILIESAHA